jgi:hypothetical protein
MSIYMSIYGVARCEADHSRQPFVQAIIYELVIRRRSARVDRIFRTDEVLSSVARGCAHPPVFRPSVALMICYTNGFR